MSAEPDDWEAAIDKLVVHLPRSHVSSTADPIVLKDKSAEVGQESRGVGHGKPPGFWYEVDGDWQRWVHSERWGHGWGHLHEVDLGESNVLLIDTVEKFDAFHLEYRHVPPRYQGRVMPPGMVEHLREPNWARLSEEYDGIEIAPYLWERRLNVDTSWYYGWDCASGILWRPRGATVTYHGPLPALRRDGDGG